jgi:hypothetical protein
VRRGLALELTARDDKVTEQSLKKRIMLMASPEHECVPRASHGQRLPLVVKKGPASFRLTTTADMHEGEIYGIYALREPARDYCLRYLFRARGAPKIIGHDLGEGEPKRIDRARRRIRLTFDQPVILTRDDALSLISRDGAKAHPAIERIDVAMDQQTLWLYIEGFVDGAHYQLIFGDGLSNDLRWPTTAKPIDLLVDGSTMASMASPPLKPRLEVASHFAQAYWPLPHEQRLDIFVKEEEATDYSLLPIPFSMPSTKNSAMFLQKLRAATAYDYIARAEDAHGVVHVARGHFVTNREQGVTISEIMIDPHTDGDGQSAGEYIEIANVGAPIAVADLTLRIEDLLVHKDFSCQIIGDQMINTGEFALIVGNDFKPSLYGLDGTAKIIRLPSKSLCHGLSNQRPKNIKIFNGDGFLIDQLSADASRVKGQAIIRIAAEGLALEHKYCYSKPTPGKHNASCG